MATEQETASASDGIGAGAMQISDLTKTLIEELTGWVHAAVALLPQLLIALVIVTLGWFGSRFAGRMVRRALDRFSSNAKANSLFATIATIAVFGGSIFVALGILGLDKTVASLLAGVGVIGLALGFAFQDIAANFMSGILMAFRHEFRQGDIIRSNDFFGKVTRITLRSTHLRQFSGEEVIVPNKDVFSNPLVNMTTNGGRRVEVAVGVAYGSDLELVERATREAIETVPGRDEDKGTDVLFTGFGGSSVDLVARFWVPYTSQLDYLKAQSAAIVAIHTVYESHDIDIPFPIRTLRFADEVVQEVDARIGHLQPVASGQ